VNLRLEVCCWLSHDHLCHGLEAGVLEAPEELRPLFLDEICLHFHDHVVSGLCGYDRVDDATGAEVVEERHAELRVRLVIGMLPRGSLARGDAALLCPSHNRPVGKLEEVGVLLQPAIEPVEGSFVWKSHWKDHLALSVVCRSFDTVCGT